MITLAMWALNFAHPGWLLAESARSSNPEELELGTSSKEARREPEMDENATVATNASLKGDEEQR